MIKNKDHKIFDGFVDEWKCFDQSKLAQDEQQSLFDKYFSIFPWTKLPEEASGFDMGCGSGRWGKLLAPRVRTHLEQRFTKSQIKNMMEGSGLENIVFFDKQIYWLAEGYKKEV